MIGVELQHKEELQAAGRSQIYARLAQGLHFPTDRLYHMVVSGQMVAETIQAVAALPYPFSLTGSWGQGLALSQKELEAEYIRLFDVGGPLGPPCSLYEGEHGGGRMKVMEDLLRLYGHFGLRLASARNRERPDYLSLELEYMHYLTFREAESLARGGGQGPYALAQRDFLEVHLVDFTAEVSRRVSSLNVPFYSDLARDAARFCRSELAYLGG